MAYRRATQSESDCMSCGINYRDFHTGLNFAEVRRMMYSGSTDPSQWRSKRRRSVLGYWHELKRQLWLYHLSLENSP
jgi:hypothetical protein